MVVPAYNEELGIFTQAFDGQFADRVAFLAMSEQVATAATESPGFSKSRAARSKSP